MSAHRIASLRLRAANDVVLARSRALQCCGLLGVSMLDRSRFASAVSAAARAVVAGPGGRILLEGTPLQLRAVFQVDGAWKAPSLQSLVPITPTPEGAHIQLDLNPPRTDDQLVQCGAQLARMRHGLTGSASLVTENQALRAALDEHDVEARRAARLAMRLDQQRRDLQLFASAAGHDLREPLVAIGLYTRLLRRQLESGDHDAVQSALDSIDQSVAHARAMLDGLVAYGRLAHEDLEDAVASPMEVLEQVRETLKVQLDARGARILVQPPLHPVRMRPEHLAQVLQNLLTNALKFSDDTPTVHITSQHRDDGIHLSVRDQGRGIPEEDQPDVFHLFQRAHHDRPGTGVGLALVARIVRAAGGRVHLESTVGQGTTITLVLLPA